MGRRSRYKGTRRRSKDAVSEVVGTILTVAITVILFSGIALYVGTMPTPKGSTSTSFAGQSTYNTESGRTFINITQMGGQVLDNSDTRVLINVNGNQQGDYSLIEGGLTRNWAPGMTWSYTISGLAQTAIVQALIYQRSVGDVVWQGTISDVSPSNVPTIISRGIWDGYGTYNTPIYASTPVHFYARFSPSQAIDNLIVGSMKVDATSIGLGEAIVLEADPANMYFFYNSLDSLAQLTWSGKTVKFFFDYYTDTGHTESQRVYVPATLQVLKNTNGNGNGNGTSGNPPQNINYSALQGFNIFEKSDWEANEYNATPRVNFANTEMAVVVVASQYLVNVMGKNDLAVMNSATGIIHPSVSSPANIFSPFAYYAGHYVYTATIDFNQVDPDQYYSISMGLKDTWSPQNSMIATTQVRVGGESTQLYPIFETFSDPGYTIPCDTFSMNDKIYVQIKTLNGYAWEANGGSVMIKDFFGGSQVNRAPELPATTAGYVYTTNAGKATIIGYSGVGGELVIPATLGGFPVVFIGNAAFQNHDEITSVTIPEFVTTIGSSAFRGCSAMDWISIGANVTTIGSYAFEGCADLTSIKFLGRAAPTVTDGASNWIDNTPATLRGQALATSSFLPSSDSNHNWNGLPMGLLMPVEKNPVSTVAQLGGSSSNTYRFSIDLALASQQPWINGQNHYTLNYDTFKTTGEQYYLGKIIYVSGPFQTLDIVTAGGSIGDHHRHLADSTNAVQYYLNDDDWQDPYAVATYVDDGRSHHWSAPEGSIATIGDIDGDGSADIVAILYDNADMKETETSLNVYVNDGTGAWSRTIIAMLPYGAYPTALTLGNADLDGDLDIFVAYSFVQGKHHINPNAVGSVGVFLNDGAWTYKEILNSNAPIKYISVGDLDINQGTNIAGCSFDVLVGFDRVGTGATGAFVIYKNINHMGYAWTAIPITFSDGTSPREAGGVLIADLDSTWKNEIVLLDKWQQVWVGSYDLNSGTASAARISVTARTSDPSPDNALSYGLGTGVVIGKRGERLQDIVVTLSSWSKISSKVYMTTIDITVLDQKALNTFSKEALAPELFYFNEDHHHARDRTNPTTMVVADIDGNGLADILLGGSDGEIRLLENIKGSTDVSSWMPIQVDMGSEGLGWTQTSVVASLSVGNIHGGTTIGPVVVPGVPELSATPSNVQVALSWSGPAIDGGSPITHYKVYRSTTTSTGTYTMISSFSGGIQNYIDTDVDNGHTYWYRISAVNAMGEGAQCAPISALPATQKPGAPTGLSAIASGTSVSLSWATPSNNGGSDVTSYKIYRSTTAEGTYSLIIPQPLITITSLGGSATDTGLINSQTYWYKVSAVNEKGEGVTSGSASATIPARAPDAPTGLTGVPANKKVTLTWVAPLNNGGAGIDYYLVYVNGVVQSTHYTSLTATISSLNNGTPYTFTVVAHNSAGLSAYSNVISVTPHN